MIVDLTQEEIDLIKALWAYLDYLGYAPSESELALIASIQTKLEGA